MRVRVEAEVGEMLSRATSQSQSRWKGDYYDSDQHDEDDEDDEDDEL